MENEGSRGLSMLLGSLTEMCHATRPSSVRAALSSLIGGLCAQPGDLCLHRLDLGLDLPLEGAAPFGQLRLAEHLEALLQLTMD